MKTVWRGDSNAGAARTPGRSDGNFTVSTRECIVDDYPATHIVDELKPPEDEGFWFLVRAVNALGAGTYDSWGPGQVGSRDAEIAASPAACP